MNKRICPMPIYWNDLFKQLTIENKEVKINSPLILGAWNFSSDFEKLARFKEHLSLVNTRSESYKLLDSLTEDNWYHENE